MKRIMIALFALASVGTVMAQTTSTTTTTTTTTVQKKFADVATVSPETFDFGKIKQNVPATATFTVTNISNEPIIIEQASPTCGCTISDYTKTPIPPKGTGTIKATYNAAAAGAIHKTLTVKIANTSDIKSISLAGEVMTEAPKTAQTDAVPVNTTTTKTTTTTTTAPVTTTSNGPAMMSVAPNKVAATSVQKVEATKPVATTTTGKTKTKTDTSKTKTKTTTTKTKTKEVKPAVKTTQAQ